ncbi:MAG: BON domain-containing protein [Chloroflexota bacterium]
MNPPLPDADVTRLVREAIEQDVRFITLSIGVTTTHGAVTLSGLVPDPLARASLVAVARGIPGVVRVVDQLQVRPFLPRFDADVTADVVSAVTRLTTANPAKIDVQTIDGVIHLRGTVPDPTTRQTVDALARSVNGARDVIDDLDVVIGVPHTDAEIARAIENRLRATLRPEVADQIHVTVHQGIASLRGGVDTTATRWAIDDLTRWVPGVIDVVDQLSGDSASRTEPNPSWPNPS